MAISSSTDPATAAAGTFLFSPLRAPVTLGVDVTDGLSVADKAGVTTFGAAVAGARATIAWWSIRNGRITSRGRSASSPACSAYIDRRDTIECSGWSYSEKCRLREQRRLEARCPSENEEFDLSQAGRYVPYYQYTPPSVRETGELATSHEFDYWNGRQYVHELEFEVKR